MDEAPAKRSILFWAVSWGIPSFIAAMAIAIPLHFIFKEPSPGIEQLKKNPGLLMAILVLIPFLETLFGQWLPIAITGIFTRSAAAKVVVSSLVFAALHISNSWSNAVVILLTGGPVFAYTFVRFRRESRWRAYLATSLTHTVHNALAGLLLLAGL